MLEEKYERTLQDEAKELEQLLSKRNILLSKQEDFMKKIRDLGSLPSDAFDTWDLPQNMWFSLPIKSYRKKNNMNSYFKL